MNLPPAETQPLDRAGRRAQLGDARGRFLNAAIGDEPVFTGTKLTGAHCRTVVDNAGTALAEQALELARFHRDHRLIPREIDVGVPAVVHRISCDDARHSGQLVR